MLQLVYSHENSKKLHSILKELEKISRELELEIENVNEELAPTILAKKRKRKAKNLGLKLLEQSGKINLCTDSL